MHLSLQEYFAACYLEPRLTASRFANVKKTSPTDEQLKKWANDSSWQETFVLLFERLASKEVGESEGLFNHLFRGRLERDEDGSEFVSARLLADLTVDNYVLLSAATRQSARKQCWQWVFKHKNEYRHTRRFYYGDRSPGSYITQMLVSEQGGNLRKAWEVAGFDHSVLSTTLSDLDLSGAAK